MHRLSTILVVSHFHRHVDDAPDQTFYDITAADEKLVRTNCDNEEYKRAFAKAQGIEYNADAGDRLVFDIEHPVCYPRVPLFQFPAAKDFRVAAVSDNTGSFGHHQIYLIAADGSCWKVHRHNGTSGNSLWSRGDTVNLPCAPETGDPLWHACSVECPERQQDVPPQVLREVWPDLSIIRQ